MMPLFCYLLVIYVTIKVKLRNIDKCKKNQYEKIHKRQFKRYVFYYKYRMPTLYESQISVHMKYKSHFINSK